MKFCDRLAVWWWYSTNQKHHQPSASISNGCRKSWERKWLLGFFSLLSVRQHKRNEILRGISSKCKSQYGPKRKKENPSNINHWAHYYIILYVFFHRLLFHLRFFVGFVHVECRMFRLFRSSSSVGNRNHTITHHTHTKSIRYVLLGFWYFSLCFFANSFGAHRTQLEWDSTDSFQSYELPRNGKSYYSMKIAKCMAIEFGGPLNCGDLIQDLTFSNYLNWNEKKFWRKNHDFPNRVFVFFDLFSRFFFSLSLTHKVEQSTKSSFNFNKLWWFKRWTQHLSRFQCENHDSQIIFP